MPQPSTGHTELEAKTASLQLAQKLWLQSVTVTVPSAISALQRLQQWRCAAAMVAGAAGSSVGCDAGDVGVAAELSANN